MVGLEGTLKSIRAQPQAGFTPDQIRLPRIPSVTLDTSRDGEPITPLGWPMPGPHHPLSEEFPSTLKFHNFQPPCYVHSHFIQYSGWGKKKLPFILFDSKRWTQQPHAASYRG